MIKSNKDEMVFMSQKWFDEEGEIEEGYRDVKIKINLCKNTYSMSSFNSNAL